MQFFQQKIETESPIYFAQKLSSKNQTAFHIFIELQDKFWPTFQPQMVLIVC